MSHTPTKPVNLAHHFSKASKTRRPNALKEYYKYLVVPGMCNFSGGLPHTDLFAFDALGLSLDRPTKQSISNSDQADSECIDGSNLDIRIPRYSQEGNVAHKIDLGTALQYGSAQGYPPLYAWLRKLVHSTHHPNIPYQGGADVIVDSGSSDGLSKVFELLFNPWD
ncbi:hypothetical protein QQX98_009524 [Neonectria punicea]|uniref:Uncharacterized protein n=1 Tax=Neonectria punicea TaxID=979145 RepID=A0ABR1GS40_9HYPO